MTRDVPEPTAGSDAEVIAFASVAADHPALPGHFPGKAIVPGVVLLTEVWRAVRENFVGDLGDESSGHIRLIGMPALKFHAPVAPGDCLRIRLVRAGESIRFTVHRGAMEQCDAAIVLSGTLQCRHRQDQV